MINFLIWLISCCIVLGQKQATTDDGKKVLLKDDGTWEYVEKKLLVNLEDSIWEVKYFVDDFGDFTDSGYISASLEGKFSNSATTNSDLGVRFIITKQSVAIKLYEYNRNHPVSGKISEKEYTILVKHNGAKLPQMSGENYSDRIVMMSIYSEHLIKLFKGGGSFIFVIKQREGSASEYKFKLKDTSGFALAWDQLYKKN